MMESSGLSPTDFFQLTVDSLLKLGTHCIDGHCIVSIEGRLLLTLDNGDKFELNILPDDVGSLPKADDAFSADISDIDKNIGLEDNLSHSKETGLSVDDGVGVESLNDIHEDVDNAFTLATETELCSSYVDNDEQSMTNAESMPSAVLQPNGEFMCSSCGEVATCARYIKQHISTHMSQSLSGTSVPLPPETNGDIDKDTVTQKRPKNQGTSYKQSRRPEICTDNSERFQKPESKVDADSKWYSYPCSDCKNSFRSNDLLQLHHVQMHKPHECKKCGTVLAGRRNFSQHVRTEHRDQDKKIPIPRTKSKVNGGTDWHFYRCKYCEDTFTSSNMLYSHRVLVHKMHQCQKCGTVVAGQRNFSQHVRKEHPGVPILKAMKHLMCEYCSRTFKSPAPLKDHISTYHLGTVEHRCDQCGKVLSSETTLRIHQRYMHQDDYKRTCDGCGRQFSRTADLMDHLTKDHPHLLPEKYRSRLDTLVCKQCNIIFSRSNSLLRHKEVIHGGAPKYSCAVCSRRFRCRRYVLRHLHSRHPDVSATNRSVVVVDSKNEKNDS